MKPNGIRGSYREACVDFVAKKICCVHCGFNQSSEESIPYELWYKVTVKGHVVWAQNRQHAKILVSYLLNQIQAPEIYQSVIETLPSWMIKPKNRILIGQKFDILLKAD